MFHPDWRIVGAIGYLWFDIAVLFACFAASGHMPALAPVVLAYQIGYLSNFIPVPGGIGVLDGFAVQSYMGAQHYSTTQRYLHHKPRPQDAELLHSAFAGGPVSPAVSRNGDIERNSAPLADPQTAE